MQYSLFKLQDSVNLLPYDGEAIFYSDFLSYDEAQRYFEILLNETAWEQWPIILFDKELKQPRLTALYGDEDKLLERPGKKVVPIPWTETLKKIKNKADQKAGTSFTHALLNLYRNEKDSVSWHRDSDKIWGPEPVIGSVSLGTTRTFQIRNYKNKSITRSIELTPGSLLIMRGPMQRFWEHQVPKVNKRLNQRINITFRIMI